VGMLLRGEYGWAALHTTWHLGGSILMTALGIATYRALA
jgi:fluoride exporter